MCSKQNTTAGHAHGKTLTEGHEHTLNTDLHIYKTQHDI